MFTFAMPQSESVVETKSLRLAHIERKDGGGEARADGVVQSNCLIELVDDLQVSCRKTSAFRSDQQSGPRYLGCPVPLGS